MEDGHVPLPGHLTAPWEKGCACNDVLTDTDNSWNAVMGWEHTLLALVCSPAPWASCPLPVNALTPEAQTMERVREAAASISWTCPFPSPLDLAQYYTPWGVEEVRISHPHITPFIDDFSM